MSENNINEAVEQALVRDDDGSENFLGEVYEQGAQIARAMVGGEDLAQLTVLLQKMTPAPWMSEKSFSHAYEPNVHWSIHTVEKMPDTPWSPRFITWMTGCLRDAHSINRNDDGYHYCDHCKRGYLGHREAGVEVRVDEQTEADVQGIVLLRNLGPALIERIAELEELSVCGIVTGSWTENGATFTDVCENRRPCADHPPDAWLIERGRADGAEEVLLAQREEIERLTAQRNGCAYDLMTRVHTLEARVTELQEANTREVERRRVAEASLSAERIAAAALPVADVEPFDAVKELRSEWWVNHGCPTGALHGDDREMACNRCGIDFKRTPIALLAEVVSERRMQRSKELAAKTEVQATAGPTRAHLSASQSTVDVERLVNDEDPFYAWVEQRWGPGYTPKQIGFIKSAWFGALEYARAHLSAESAPASFAQKLVAEQIDAPEMRAAVGDRWSLYDESAPAVELAGIREEIERRYEHVQLGSGAVGGTFGEILCHELHQGDDPRPAGLHFGLLAEKWGVSLHMLGRFIADHCDRLAPAPSVAQPEITRVIDGKFHIANGQIVKTSSGEIVPEWEPLILQRGRDHLMLPTLRHYRQLSVLDGCNDYHLAGIDAVIEKFEAFTREHPEWMKQPGVTRGAAFTPRVARDYEDAKVIIRQHEETIRQLRARPTDEPDPLRQLRDICDVGTNDALAAKECDLSLANDAFAALTEQFLKLERELERLLTAIAGVPGSITRKCDPVELLTEERRLARSEMSLLLAERDGRIRELEAAQESTDDLRRELAGLNDDIRRIELWLAGESWIESIEFSVVDSSDYQRRLVREAFRAHLNAMKAVEGDHE